MRSAVVRLKLWTAHKSNEINIPKPTMRSNGRNSPTNDELCDVCTKVPLRALLSHHRERLVIHVAELHTRLPPSSSSYRFQPPLLVSPNSPCPFCRVLAASFHGVTTAVESIYPEELGDTLTLEGHDAQSFCIRASTSTKNASQPHHQSKKKGSRIVVLGSDAFRLSSRRFSYARQIAALQADRDLIKSWLRSCLEHKACHKATSVPDPVSKFLIDVKSMCVVDVGNARYEYFTLGYAWESSSSLQMIQANKTALMTPGYLKENMNQLSPVFQDAIKITRELNKRYLWVDRLCICQDDSQSKHEQISNINSIYKQASLMLAAATETSPSSGLPGVRPFKSPRSQSVEFVHGMHLTTLLPPLSETQSKFFERVWTHQEERLSSRILFFTERQVYFACLQSVSCEDRWEDSSPYPRGGQILRDIYPHTPFDWWKNAVSKYSTREYSHDEDRYNAFQGISVELRERFKYPCIRSLPEHDFVAALCWKTSPKAQRISCLPSWTWSGWSGSVEFPYSTIESLIPRIQLCMEAERMLETESPARYSSHSGSGGTSLQELKGKDEAFRGAVESSAAKFAAEGDIALKGPFPLVLDFFALSALLDMKSQNGSWSVENVCSPSLNGDFSIAHDHQFKRKSQRLECIRLGTTGSIRTSHCHSQAEEEIDKSSKLLQQFQKGPPLTKSLVRTRQLILLIVECDEGSVHQRVGLGVLDECCFLAHHPIERKVSLG